MKKYIAPIVLLFIVFAMGTWMLKDADYNRRLVARRDERRQSKENKASQLKESKTQFYSDAFQAEIPIEHVKVQQFVSVGSQFTETRAQQFNELISVGQLVFKNTEFQKSVDLVEKRKGELFKIVNPNEIAEKAVYGAEGSAAANYSEGNILLPEKFFEVNAVSSEYSFLGKLSLLYHEIDHLTNDVEYPKSMDKYSRFKEMVRRELRNHTSDLRRLEILLNQVHACQFKSYERWDAAFLVYTSEYNNILCHYELRREMFSLWENLKGQGAFLAMYPGFGSPNYTVGEAMESFSLYSSPYKMAQDEQYLKMMLQLTLKLSSDAKIKMQLQECQKVLTKTVETMKKSDLIKLRSLSLISR